MVPGRACADGRSTRGGNLYPWFLRYLDNRILVRYEDLTRQPERTLGVVLSFLGLSGAEELVRAFDMKRSFEGHGSSRSPEASIAVAAGVS